MFKLGADPEFEFHTEDTNTFQSASNILGSRSFHSKVGCDGCSNTGELRPTPAETPEQLVKNISRLITSLYSKVRERNLNVFAGSGTNVPLGGHIHFSEVTEDAELLNKLDQFISVPLNKVSDRSVRQGRYGGMSETRYQPHGWEYRTPLSWICHPKIAAGVAEIAYQLVRAKKENKISLLAEIGHLITFASSEENRGQVASSSIANFYTILRKAETENIKLEQVEVFRAWKKKPLDEPQPALPTQQVEETDNIRPILEPIFNTEDFNLNLVSEMWNRISRGVQNNGSIRVIGAREERTNEDIVFIPRRWETRQWNYCFFGTRIVRFRKWDNDNIGLSHSLRQDPEKAAKALLSYLKKKARYEHREVRNAQSSPQPIFYSDIIRRLECAV